MKYAPGAEPCGLDLILAADESVEQSIQNGFDTGVLLVIIFSALVFASAVGLLAWRIAYARGKDAYTRFHPRTGAQITIANDWYLLCISLRHKPLESCRTPEASPAGTERVIGNVSTDTVIGNIVPETEPPADAVEASTIKI